MVEITLEIDGEVKEYSMPNSWDEVTVGQYENIRSIKLEGLTDIEVSNAYITELTGMDEDEAGMIPVTQWPEIASQLEFIGKKIENKPSDSVEIEGEEFFLVKEYDKLSIAEVASIDSLNKITEGQIDQNLSMFLCILVRKKKENGKIESFRNSFIESRKDKFKNVKVSEVYNVLSFFLTGKHS